MTNQPLEKTLQKMDSSSHLLKWAIQLLEYDIQYNTRTTIKAQALATFIVEASYEERGSEWILSSMWGRPGAGIAMTTPEGNTYEYAIKFPFPTPNYESECEAAIVGLKMCIAAGAKSVSLKTDSQLVSGQLRGEFSQRNEHGEVC